MMQRLVPTAAILVLAGGALAQNAVPPKVWANKFFSGADTEPPPVILKDFGTLPKGTVKTHTFKMANIYQVGMDVKPLPPSCGCVSLVEYTGRMEPRESGYVTIKIDTHKVEGPKTIKVPIHFAGRDANGQLFESTAQIEVRALIRPDIAMTPGSFQFQTVPAGKGAELTVIVAYHGGQRKWEVNGVKFNEKLFDVTHTPVRGRGTAYQITAKLKKDAPVGAFEEQIVLNTNDRDAPVLAITASGRVQAALTVVGLDPSGEKLVFPNDNKIKVGEKKEINLVFRADRAFKIKEIAGQGDGISVTSLPVPAAKVATVSVVFAPDKAGTVKKLLTVRTDIGESVSFTVEATAVPADR